MKQISTNYFQQRMIKFSKILCLIILGMVVFTSCSKESVIDEPTAEIEISKRNDASPSARESCKETDAGDSQQLDLTGKNLKRQSGQSMEDFLSGLGFDTSNLCEGSCRPTRECVVTNVKAPDGSEVATIPGQGSNKIIRGFRIKNQSQNLSDVTVKLTATCKCKSSAP